MDASTPGVAEAAGVDAVEPMTALPAELNKMAAANRSLTVKPLDAARLQPGAGAGRLTRRHSRHGQGARGLTM